MVHAPSMFLSADGELPQIKAALFHVKAMRLPLA
jgi:hypothetical protein